MENLKRRTKYAGAIVAYLIESRLENGQEILQYFAAYGAERAVAGILLTLLIMMTAVVLVLHDSQVLKLQDVNQLFRFYCGKYLGIVFEWVTPTFLFAIYVIMLSGASSLLSEYWGLPALVGRTIMLILSLGTVLLGLNRLTDIVGHVGPVIIFCAIFISLGCILKNPQALIENASLVTEYNLTKATDYWWLSAINYGTFCTLTLIPFLAGIGARMKDKQECTASGCMGTIAFCLSAMLISLGLLSYLSVIYNKDVPSVYMADCLFPGMGMCFSLVLFAGIYTTAVPMLWTACNKIEKNDKSVRFVVVACILAMIAFFGSSLPFSTLVNIVYPYMGYVGCIVIACVYGKHIKRKIFA